MDARADLRPTRVVLVLDEHRIEGTLYLDPSKARFSDAWDALLLAEQRGFLPLTDAMVVSHGSRESQSIGFVLVDKTEVRLVSPLEEMPEASGPARRTPIDPVEVVLHIGDLRIQGTVHPEAGKTRFSDGWEALLRGRHRFLAVTDAVVEVLDGRPMFAGLPFALVDKQKIQVVYPVGHGTNDGSATRRIDRIQQRAALVLDGLRVEGTVHVDPPIPRFSRFSDMFEALMRDRRSFVPVTSARLLTHDGAKELGSTEFMIVDKAYLKAAFPLD